jgi:hypothetical protein
VPLTDTKSKRLVIIVVVLVAVLAAATTFVQYGHALAEHKADGVERAATALAARTTYEDAAALESDRFVLRGVRPSIVDDAIPGELVVVWDVQKWGVRRCITVRWDQGSAAVVRRGDCSTA